MLQKIELQQLRTKSLEEIKTYKEQALARRSELESIKAKGKAWSAELQEELDDIAIFLVDVDDVLDEKMLEQPAKTNNGYEVKPGTEKMVHVSIVRGRRFNSNTGKEISKPFNQMFTFSEWQLFKKNFAILGYTITAVLHDPYGDAKQLIAKN